MKSIQPASLQHSACIRRTLFTELNWSCDYSSVGKNGDKRRLYTTGVTGDHFFIRKKDTTLHVLSTWSQRQNLLLLFANWPNEGKGFLNLPGGPAEQRCIDAKGAVEVKSCCGSTASPAHNLRSALPQPLCKHAAKPAFWSLWMS